jgi:hypothetical protein
MFYAYISGKLSDTPNSKKTSVIIIGINGMLPAKGSYQKFIILRKRWQEIGCNDLYRIIYIFFYSLNYIPLM